MFRLGLSIWSSSSEPNLLAHSDVRMHKVDYQLIPNNTLSIRYRVTNSDIPNPGLGSFNLVETAYHAHSCAQTTQLVETVKRHPGAPAALPARHFGQRVHAGVPGERAGDGRIGVLDADERRGKNGLLMICHKKPQMLRPSYRLNC